MALITLGSNGTTTLTAMKYRSGANPPADFAALAALILDDRSSPNGQLANLAPSAKPIWPGGFNRFYGFLAIPNRGFLKVLPGDYIAVDANGWPILLSANAIAGGASPSAATSWTHS